MTKFVALLGLKAEAGNGKPPITQLPPAAQLTVSPVTAPPPPVSTAPAAPIETQVEEPETELENELFTPVAGQLGEENETVRNLLKDAEHKIGELETIKVSIAKLVDPVYNTLRGYEETKSEKLIIQRALTSTRQACDKLREDLGAAEKKAATFKSECARLQEIATAAKQDVASLERGRAEMLAELAVQRARVAELQTMGQQQSSELRLSRDENRRLADRVTAGDQRAVQLEHQAQTAQQQARQANQERGAVQASLDRALSDLAQTTRRLSDADKVLTAAQARLQALEKSLAEVQAERARLSTAIEEAAHAHRDAMNLLTSRFEAVQARSSLADKLLVEARQTLLARAEEVRTFERNAAEAATANDALAEKLGTVQAKLDQRELQIRDIEQARTLLAEQAQKLINAATGRERDYEKTQHKVKEQADLIAILQEQLTAARSSNEMQVEGLSAQLQREQLERSLAEGALEAARKDVARLQLELDALRTRLFVESGPEAIAETIADGLKRAA